MRNFFQPADGPSWLGQVLSSIRAALGDIWPSPLRLAQYTTAKRPPATDTPLGGMIFDTTDNRPAYSTASAWFELMPYTAGAALTSANDTNVTITLGGTPATALLQAVSLTVGWTGQLAVTRGGSGLSSAVLGDLWYGSAANAMAALAGNITATKQFLVQTGTGAVSAAPTWGTIAAADVPTLNQNTTGSAAKWTTARNLAGNSVDGSANVAFANKFVVQGTADTGLSAAQFLGALGTGIVKNTTTTGVLSIAVAGDFPTLNQNTSGSAATLTTARNFSLSGGGITSATVSFDGSAAVVLVPSLGAITPSSVAATGACGGASLKVGTVTLVDQTGGANAYHEFHTPSANTALHLGGSADATNYYSNTAHVFRNTAGTTYLQIESHFGNFANDAAAATGSVPVGGVYRNGSVLMVRVA